MAVVFGRRRPVVYLAARFSRFDELNEHKKALEGIGFLVKARWLDGGHEWSGVDDNDIPSDEAIRFAIEDLEDIRNADMVWAFTEEPRSGHSRGGRHVEAGYALGTRKPLVLIGPRENVFYTLDVGSSVESEARTNRFTVAGSVSHYDSFEMALMRVPRDYPYLFDKENYARVQTVDIIRELRALRNRARFNWPKDSDYQHAEVLSAMENLMLRLKAYGDGFFRNGADIFGGRF